MSNDFETFEMRDEHLKLLRRMYVGWNDCEFGAPEIDPKRPYGNSDVEYDIAEILGITPEEMDDGYPSLSDDQRLFVRSLHANTSTALQIVLTTGRFEPGIYRRERYVGDWEKAK